MDVRTILFNAIENLSPFTFLIIFIGTALLSLTSCSLIRIPIVLGFTSGMSTSRKDTLRMLSGFVIGSALTYTCLGILLGMGGKFLVINIEMTVYFYIISGIFLLLLGAYLLGFIPKFKPSLKNHCITTHHSKKINPFDKPRSTARGLLTVDTEHRRNINFLSSFMFGISFSFLEAPACPCCGPILLLLGTTVIARGEFLFAAGVFLSYAFGQNLPVIIACLSTESWRSITQRVPNGRVYSQIIAGTLLFCIGLYLIWMA